MSVASTVTKRRKRMGIMAALIRNGRVERHPHYAGLVAEVQQAFAPESRLPVAWACAVASLGIKSRIPMKVNQYAAAGSPFLGGRCHCDGDPHLGPTTS